MRLCHLLECPTTYIFYRQIIKEHFDLAKYFCYNDKYLHHVNMNRYNFRMYSVFV